MVETIHITSGDNAGGNLLKAGLPVEVFVWHDIMYDGPRCPGWPDEQTLNARSIFLEKATAGGLNRQYIMETLNRQYRKLMEAVGNQHIVLWFDACLFDQSMLAHILTCLFHRGAQRVNLICVDEFPGIEPFHGLGQMRPNQLASVYGNRRLVTESQFRFAVQVDEAFATQDSSLLTELAQVINAPLPWTPAAITRWLQEYPDPHTGLGRLEDLTLRTIRSGCEKPGKIFASVAALDTPPQFWGDITLWEKINALADREPPLVKIEGPMVRLPQWECEVSVEEFTIKALPNYGID